jgi:predicted cation transporter
MCSPSPSCTYAEQISVRDLLRKFKAKGVVYLYMAVLMGYRLLVMGHNVSTSDICQCVPPLFTLPL